MKRINNDENTIIYDDSKENMKKVYIGKVDEWICTKCSNRNFLFRENCNRCGNQKIISDNSKDLEDFEEIQIETSHVSKISKKIDRKYQKLSLAIKENNLVKIEYYQKKLSKLHQKLQETNRKKSENNEIRQAQSIEPKFPFKTVKSSWKEQASPAKIAENMRLRQVIFIKIYKLRYSKKFKKKLFCMVFHQQALENKDQLVNLKPSEIARAILLKERSIRKIMKKAKRAKFQAIKVKGPKVIKKISMKK